MTKKAEAWREFKDAAMIEMYLDALPKVIVSPIANLLCSSHSGC